MSWLLTHRGQSAPPPISRPWISKNHPKLGQHHRPHITFSHVLEKYSYNNISHHSAVIKDRVCTPALLESTRNQWSSFTPRHNRLRHWPRPAEPGSREPNRYTHIAYVDFLRGTNTWGVPQRQGVPCLPTHATCVNHNKTSITYTPEQRIHLNIICISQSKYTIKYNCRTKNIN